MPFIGDGDIAAELYGNYSIYGADIDNNRVETARSRLKGSDIRIADCNGWAFSDVEEPFSLADLDAYCNPYMAFESFWKNANKTKRVLVFGTDGMRQRISRGRVLKVLPSGEETPSSQFRAVYNFWWSKHALPFLAETIKPSRIIKALKYQRGQGMLCWGIVIENV